MLLPEVNRFTVPKYLVQGRYTVEGLQGLKKDKASGRRRSLKKALAGLGGKLESIHYCLGDDDVVIIAEMPDSIAAAAISLAASASGLVTTRTTALLTVEEVDSALAMESGYRPPGAKSN